MSPVVKGYRLRLILVSCVKLVIQSANVQAMFSTRVFVLCLITKMTAKLEHTRFDLKQRKAAPAPETLLVFSTVLW